MIIRIPSFTVSISRSAWATEWGLDPDDVDKNAAEYLTYLVQDAVDDYIKRIGVDL